ncbi:MAG: histidine--tRNA ligase [Candidatus Vogelbacteria bacterium]|nr:histidine--tRNA ligase [Candidatus Vogelbacteria bacterium]
MNQSERRSKKDSQFKLQTAKGLRDIIGEEYYLLQGLTEKASEVAIYYGFRPIATPILEDEELFRKAVGQDTDIVAKELYALRTRGGDRLALRPEATAPIMRAYFEHGFQAEPQPVMFYAAGPFFRHDSPQRGRFREFHQFDLEIIGTNKSIADALVIRLILIILKEAGLAKLAVELNSLGDRDCRPIFRRELVNYYKKQVRQICAVCRERLKTNPLRLLDCKNPKCQELKAGAPSAVGFLCHACKQHFKEVLEYLEAMEITYTINNNLVRGLDYYTRTVFEVSEPNDGAGGGLALAGGGRYDYLSRALGAKKVVPAVGGAIGLNRVIQSPKFTRLTPRLLKKPKVFFIQLSLEAKMHSLQVIEILRRARVPLAHSLSKDSLSAQLTIAEKMKIPYTIILGQKEVIDGTVIVRDMNTRSQASVKLNKLAEYLEKC